MFPRELNPRPQASKGARNEARDSTQNPLPGISHLQNAGTDYLGLILDSHLPTPVTPGGYDG